MSINVNLLKEICEIAGAPGFESRVREIVLREIRPLCDDISIDNMGNMKVQRLYATCFIIPNIFTENSI